MAFCFQEQSLSKLQEVGVDEAKHLQSMQVRKESGLTLRNWTELNWTGWSLSNCGAMSWLEQGWDNWDIQGDNENTWLWNNDVEDDFEL